MAYEVPALPYDYNALEPHVDEATMRVHHDKHHQAYVDKANAALQGTEHDGKPVEEVLRALDSLPVNVLLMGKGNTLYTLDPARDTVWRPVRSFAGPGLRNLTAYAVSPRGDRLVFYSSARVPLEVELRDSLQAGRGAAEVAAHARRLAAQGSVAVAEGGLLGLGGELLGRRPADAAELFAVAIRNAHENKSINNLFIHSQRRNK